MISNMAHLSIGRSSCKMSCEQMKHLSSCETSQLIGGISLLTARRNDVRLVSCRIVRSSGKEKLQANFETATRRYFQVATGLLPCRHWRDEYSLESWSCLARPDRSAVLVEWTPSRCHRQQSIAPVTYEPAADLLMVYELENFAAHDSSPGTMLSRTGKRYLPR
jgi:hypothetical protein